MILKGDIHLIEDDKISLRINSRIKNKVRQFAQNENLKISQYIKGLILRDLKSNGHEIEIQETITISTDKKSEDEV